MPLFPEPPAFKNRPILFLDFEMTGLDVNRHEIVEIAALVVRQPDLAVTNSYYTKVQPQHIETAVPESLELIDFTPQNWQAAIPLRRALVELSSLAPDCVLAGFGIQNEWNFLIYALDQEKLPYFFNHNLIEVWTLAFSKYFRDPQVSNIGLTNLCRMLNIPLERHKPDSDIRATYEIFKRLVNQNPAK